MLAGFDRGDRLFTMYGGDLDGEAVEFAAAFDAKTGDEIWRVPLGEKYDTEFGNGPRTTPTVDGDTVYLMDSHGTFVALATEHQRRPFSDATFASLASLPRQVVPPHCCHPR